MSTLKVTNIKTENSLTNNIELDDAGNVTMPNGLSLTTPLPVSSGGTGTDDLTLNNVLLGNGTNALQVVAPGTSGNVLTSDGTTWESQALSIPPSLGVDQVWSSPGRSSGTWYQNTTGKPIMVAVSLCVEGTAFVGPNTGSYVTVFSMGSASGCGPFEQTTMSFVVPNNYYYKATVRNLLAWTELR